MDFSDLQKAHTYVQKHSALYKQQFHESKFKVQMTTIIMQHLLLVMILPGLASIPASSNSFV